MANFNLSDILHSHSNNLSQDNHRYQEHIYIGMLHNLSVLELIPMAHYACVICTKGRASVSVNFTNYEISEGDVIAKFDTDILISKGQSADFEVRCLIWSGEYYEMLTTDFDSYRSLFLAHKFPNKFSMKQHEYQVVLNSTQQLLYILNYIQESLVISTLSSAMSTFGKILFNMLHDHLQDGDIKPSNFTRYDSIFSSFIELVIANYKKQRALGFYADKLCITTKHLSEVVKSVSRRTAVDWIDSYVITEAKIILLTSDRPVREIAEELYFESATLFSRYFKRVTSYTPREFRASALKVKD